MFSKRMILIAVALVCILALTAAVIAQAQNGQRGQRGQQPGPPGMPGGPDQPRQMDGPPCAVRLFGPPPAPMMERLAQDLQLTGEQRGQVTKLVGELAAKIKEIVGETSYLRELVAELKSETTTEAKVHDLAMKISKQEADILQAELAMWMQFEQVLTPEQRTQFWTLFPHRPGQMGPGPGGRGGPGGPGPMPPAPPPQ